MIYVSGEPDAPTDVRALDTTWNKISVTWTPGFDGGKPQDFVILVDEITQISVSNNSWTLESKYKRVIWVLQ